MLENFAHNLNQTLDCYDCTNPTIQIENMASYQVNFINEMGCKANEIHEISIDLFVPNIFSPNNDNINDNFVITGLHHNSHLKVYNRWGGLVYRSDNYQNNWNGKSINNGKNLTDGVYYYVLDNLTKHKPISGYVVIMR